jgi:hypothetical protein
MRRLGPIRYKVNLTDRKEKGDLSPTWIYIPLLTDKIDVLEIKWQIRTKKTSSIVTFDGEDSIERQGHEFSATLAMLERFVERGVSAVQEGEKEHSYWNPGG